MENSQYKTLNSAYKRGLEAEGKTIDELKAGSENNAKGKGNMGDAFEKWFGKPQDNKSDPDLMPAHVELKTTPFRKLKNSNKYSAKERLVFDMINYFKLVKETFYTSHFLYKDRNILLAFYRYLGPGKKNKAKQKIYKVVLLRMLKNPSDLGVIRHDWDTIQDYVKNGNADKLSERKTQYLGACTKGRNKHSLCNQPYSNRPAKRRAFDFKTGYMTQMLRDYIIHPKKKSPSIFHGSTPPQSINLKSVILKRINKYAGYTNKELAHKFKVPLTSKSSANGSKGFNYQIISAMFGLDSQHKANGISNADELQKANIIPKTVQFNCNGNNAQSMSLPAFSFVDFSNKTWHSSKLFYKLYNTTFLLCAFKDSNNSKPKPINSTFLGATFYQFPMKDLNGLIKKVWKDTKYKAMNGTIILKATTDKNGKITVHNNLIDKSDEMIIHIRPHATKSDYSYKGKYTDYIPWGVHWVNRPNNHLKYSNNYITRQCFFINNDFIKKICKNKGLLK